MKPTNLSSLREAVNKKNLLVADMSGQTPCPILMYMFIGEKKMQNVLKRKNIYLEGIHV